MDTTTAVFMLLASCFCVQLTIRSINRSRYETVQSARQTEFPTRTHQRPTEDDDTDDDVGSDTDSEGYTQIIPNDVVEMSNNARHNEEGDVVCENPDPPPAYDTLFIR